MNNLRSRAFFKSVVAFFVITYIFCLSMSMFLIPHCVPDLTNAVSSKNLSTNKYLLNADHSKENFIRITDRSVLADDQLKPSKTTIPIILLIIFGGVLLIGKKVSFVSYQFYQYYSKQHSYLSLRMIRI